MSIVSENVQQEQEDADQSVELRPREVDANESKLDADILALEDQLSDAQTVNFWRRYFEEEEGERNYERDSLEPNAASTRLQDALN